MKFIILIILALSSFNAFGQNHYLGYNLGINIAKANRPSYSYYKSVTGFAAEVFYEFKKNHFISKSSFGFQQKGFSQELTFVDSNEVVLGQGAIEKTKFSYLALSELVGAEFGDKIFGYGCVGFSASYYLFTNVSSKDFVLDNGETTKGYEVNFQNLKPFDLAISSELGAGIKLKSQPTLTLMTNYNLGILKNRYATIHTNHPWRNNFISFRIGFKYLIK